jgi:hypothetical protein
MQSGGCCVGAGEDIGEGLVEEFVGGEAVAHEG